MKNQTSTIIEFEFLIAGNFSNTIIYNIINDLNATQHEFKFDFNEKVIPLPQSMMVAEGVLVDELEKYLKRKTAKYKPDVFKVFICESRFEEDLFSSFGMSMAMISTYYWKNLDTWAIKDRICFTLIDIIANLKMDLQFHFKNIGCPSDYCAYGEMDEGIEKSEYCTACRKQINREIAKGSISLRQYAAMCRILDYIGKRKFCFVIMPFDKQYLGVYSRAIEVPLKKNGWIVNRSDQIFQEKEVMSIIRENILRADLIVADLTGKNPNVFYELGFAHAENKNSILIAQVIDDIPFDLRHLQCVEYKNDLAGLDQLALQINNYLV